MPGKGGMPGGIMCGGMGGMGGRGPPKPGGGMGGGRGPPKAGGGPDGGCGMRGGGPEGGTGPRRASATGRGGCEGTADWKAAQYSIKFMICFRPEWCCLRPGTEEWVRLMSQYSQ